MTPGVTGGARPRPVAPLDRGTATGCPIPAGSSGAGGWSSSRHQERDGPVEDVRHDTFVERVQRAAEVVGRSEGCLGADCCTTEDGAVVSTVRWLSLSAMRASFAATAQARVDFSHDNREARPRHVLRLASVNRDESPGA